MLILMQGIPGSGKSTEAKNLASVLENCAIIELDALRAELLGDANNQNSNQRVLQVARSQAKQLLKQGFIVIIDSTLAKREWANLWIELACEMNVDIEIKKVIVDLEVAKERNKNRSRRVPDNVIESMDNDIKNFDYTGLTLMK